MVQLGLRDNPFSTRYVRPGALQYVFGCDETATSLTRRLRAQGGWGQIIGPHGSGKSTLLATLEDEFGRQGLETVRMRIRGGQRRINQNCFEPSDWNQQTQLVVDGFEQLGWFQRWRLKRFCRRFGAGLLVTAHRDMGLPTLLETQLNRQITRQLIDRLLENRGSRIDPPSVERCLRQHPSNLREAFFELYDLYESQQSRPRLEG